MLKEAYYDFQTKRIYFGLKKMTCISTIRKSNHRRFRVFYTPHYFASAKSHGIGALDNILGIDEIHKQNLTQFKSGVVEGVKIFPPDTLK